MPRGRGKKMQRTERMVLIHQMIDLRSDGMALREIAKTMDLSYTTICNWMRKCGHLTPQSPQRRIATKIREQLVCCDIYERMAACPQAGGEEWMLLRHSDDFHDICFYGEWAARIAEAPDAGA